MLCCGLVEQTRREHMSDEYKISILLMYLGYPHHGYQIHKRPTVVHYRTDQRGDHQADEHQPPKYVSYNETTKTIITSYWSEQSTNLFAFWNLIRLVCVEEIVVSPENTPWAAYGP